MLCKRTVKNQVTLPKKIMDRFKGVEYFDAESEGEKIILIPVEVTAHKKHGLAAIRKKMADLGLSLGDVDEAVNWARSK